MTVMYFLTVDVGVGQLLPVSPLRLQRGSHSHQEHQQDPAEPPCQHAEAQLHLRSQDPQPGQPEGDTDGLQWCRCWNRHVSPLHWPTIGTIELSQQSQHKPDSERGHSEEISLISQPTLLLYTVHISGLQPYLQLLSPTDCPLLPSDLDNEMR